MLVTEVMKSDSFLARHYQATTQGCTKPHMATHDLAVAPEKFQVELCHSNSDLLGKVVLLAPGEPCMSLMPQLILSFPKSELFILIKYISVVLGEKL